MRHRRPGKPLALKLILLVLPGLMYVPSLQCQQDTVTSELGFEWHKLEHLDEPTRFRFTLPRSHPKRKQCTMLWSYAIIQSNQDDFLQRVDACAIEVDTVDNHWMVLDGMFSDLTYQVYHISAGEFVPFVDFSSPHPFPDVYPDSVILFLEPGRNIESDHPDVLALSESLVQNAHDMAHAVRDIATSAYISTMPYDADDLQAVLSGTETFNWADGTCTSALETYMAGKATCAEIARLQVALCRAAGIPARTISGVVLHTWSEVWIHGYGWQQMEKGIFPDQKPPSLARLSSNDDLIWFDWTPHDTCWFKQTDVRLDQSRTSDFTQSIRMIVAHPALIPLPWEKDNERLGLIPLTPRHELYLTRDSLMTTLHLTQGQGTQPRFETSWSHLSAIDDSLTIELPNLLLHLGIQSQSNWIILDIRDRHCSTGDINCDFGIDVLDVIDIVNHILGIDELEQDQLIRADCNDDNSINVLDALSVVNIILGLLPECRGGE